MKKIIILSTLLFFHHWHSNGQTPVLMSTLNSSGNQTVINNITYEWSTGEMMLVNSSLNPSLHVTQGLLQPIIKDNIGIAPQTPPIHVSIFPNPFTDQLNIQIQDQQWSDLQYSIYDITGKLLLTKKMVSPQIIMNIPLKNYLSGTYLLKIEGQKGAEYYSNNFKIQKH